MPATEDRKVEISFHHIVGQSSTSTMRLQGTISWRTILILVDNGSTHNFIVAKLVSKLKLPTLLIPSFGVTIRNGDIILYQIYPDVAIHMPDLVLKIDFFPFNLGSADLVLLASLVGYSKS